MGFSQRKPPTAPAEAIYQDSLSQSFTPESLLTPLGSECARHMSLFIPQYKAHYANTNLRMWINLPAQSGGTYCHTYVLILTRIFFCGICNDKRCPCYFSHFCNTAYVITEYMVQNVSGIVSLDAVQLHCQWFTLSAYWSSIYLYLHLFSFVRNTHISQYSD